jgi:hypothetical protein
MNTRIIGGSMSDLSPFELHALRLGKLLGNLQSIEMGARLFLDKVDVQRASQILISLPQLKEGDWVECSPLTNGQDLRQVLERFNKFAPEQRIEVDQIVRLRDALAHGRVFGYGSMQVAKSLRLLKFARKENTGKVQVVMVEDMTEKWFDENLEFLKDALEKIRTALNWEKAALK